MPSCNSTIATTAPCKAQSSPWPPRCLAATLPGSGRVCGVAIVGRPVARHLDDGWTLEVTRLCTDVTPNACSKLYGSAWKAARALGYTRLITYTLPEEGGASLRAAGWRLIGMRGGGAWSRPSRPRADTPEHLRGPKCLWEAPGSADKEMRPDTDSLLPRAQGPAMLPHASLTAVSSIPGSHDLQGYDAAQPC